MSMKSIIITKITVQIALIAALCLLVSTAALAHNGEEHVTGTVSKISDTAVTVKTVAGKSVDVAFDAKTTFTRADKPVQKTELKVGDRVVIHAAEVNEKLIAHTVQVGAAAVAKKADH